MCMFMVAFSHNRNRNFQHKTHIFHTPFLRKEKHIQKDKVYVVRSE